MDINSKPGSTKNNKTGGWRTYKPKVDNGLCVGCGTCIQNCPEGAIQIKEDNNGNKKPKINYDYCKGCGLCAEQCPTKAIKMELEEK